MTVARQYETRASITANIQDLIEAFKFDGAASNFFHTVAGYQPEFVVFNDTFKLDDHDPFCGVEFVLDTHVDTEPRKVIRDYKYILHIVLKRTASAATDPNATTFPLYQLEKMIRYKQRICDQFCNYLYTDVNDRIREPHEGIRLDVVHVAGEDIVLGGRPDEVGSGDFMAFAIEMTILKVRETVY